MKVSRSELLKVLDQVKPGLAKKEIIEQAAHFIFTKGEVATFNDYICVTHPFEMDVEFSVRGDDFYKIINGITENDIELTLDNDTLGIKAKKTKAALSTVIGETAKVTHMIDSVRESISGKNFWKPLPKEFTNGLLLCSFSASNDLATGVRSCCAVRKDAIYTTDNIRASIYIMDSSMDEVLLPYKCVQDLIKYNVTEYGISDNWAHFRTADGITFNCKTMKGDYPYGPIEDLFSDEEPILTFPADLTDAVKAITMLAEGDGDVDKAITLDIEAGSITCKAQKERGWITKTVDTTYEGESFKLLINPVFLAQVLRQATAFSMQSGKGMFMSDNFSHILSLPMED